MIEKNISYEDTKNKKLKKKKPVVQGGVDNYLGKQPQVVAPRKWQSSPDKPATELAYITKAEKDLILKANIHGGLEGGPNMGPSGIMSLDSFGDVGGAGASGGDTSASGAANEGAGFSGRSPSEMGTDRKSQKAFEDRIENQKAQLQMAERKQAEALGYDERENIAEDKSTLDYLYNTGVGKSNLPGILGFGLNLISPLRNKALQTNIDYFKGLSTTSYPKTAQGYKDYMSDRLSGKINAAGNLSINTGDGNNIQNVLLAQQQAAIANPLGNTDTENLQGGVAQLMNQYRKNLGYTI